MGTVNKALSLLQYFNHARLEIGLTEMAGLSGVNKATVYRLMRELQAQGFVEQPPDSTAYRLGPELLRLAALREAAVPLLTVAREILVRLCEATGETAHVTILRGDKLLSLAHHYSARHGSRVTMEDASILPFHATASGLAILAFSDASFAQDILSLDLATHTPDTLTDPDTVRDRLPPIRETGIAESIGGFEADVHSLASPIFGADARPVAAVAVAAPVGRMTRGLREETRVALLENARDLTRRSGGFLPPSFPL